MLRSWDLNEVLIHPQPKAYCSLTWEAGPPRGHCSSQARGVPWGGLVLRETHLPLGEERHSETKPHPTATHKGGRERMDPWKVMGGVGLPCWHCMEKRG